MPTPTYDLISTTTLAATAPSVLFDSLPQGYRDLVIIMNTDNTVQTECYLRFNGDTASNYSTIRAQGSGSTYGATVTSNLTYMRLNGNGDFMTDFSFNGIVQLMDYSATDKHKTVISRTNSSNGLDMNSGRWASTGAISTLLIYPATGNFEANSSFAVYGIAA